MIDDSGNVVNRKENKMIDKLRIAVVVQSRMSFQTARGTIIFGRENGTDGNGNGSDYFCSNIELTKNEYSFSQCRLISAIIDTATAKGDDTLGAFLCMVREYRWKNTETGGLGMMAIECESDPAFKALQSLYEHGTLDDEVDVTCDGQTKRISRKSAIALGLLKGE